MSQSRHRRKTASVLFILVFLVQVSLVTWNLGLQNDNPAARENLVGDVPNNGRPPEPGLPQVATGSGRTPVIVSLAQSIVQADRDNFTYYGGVIDTEWDAALKGFRGTIPAENYSVFGAFPEYSVEPDARVRTAMNLAATQTGARGDDGAWNAYEINGSSNASVAMLDSGLQLSGTSFPAGYGDQDFTKQVVGWQDFTGAAATPADNHGHGTYLANVLAGNGTYEIVDDAVHFRVTRNLSHLELFPDGKFLGTHRVKVCAFEIPVELAPDPPLELNTSFRMTVWSGSVSEVGFSLESDNALLPQFRNFTTNLNQDQNYTLQDHGIPGIGLTFDAYDVFFNYTVGVNTNVTFQVTIDAWLPVVLSPADDYANFRGIAPGSKLVPLRVVDATGRGNVSDIVSALDWILQNRDAYHIAAVAISLAHDDPTQFSGNAFSTAITAVLDAGTFVVVAAGNDGLTVNRQSLLNRLVVDERAIVVGATNGDDQVAYYSAQGGLLSGFTSVKPDLVAPGGSLTSFSPTVTAPARDDYLTTGTGTSVATAIVAAAVNMLVEMGNDMWTDWRTGLTAQKMLDFKARLLMACTETGPTLLREDNPFTADVNEGLVANSPTFDDGGKDVHEGYGRLNIPAALEAVNHTLAIGTEWNETLGASLLSPTFKHAAARRVTLEQRETYRFDLTHVAGNNFRLYLYHNYSTATGEPQLLATSTLTDDGQYMAYIPLNETREYIIVVKALAGYGNFTLNITKIPNANPPSLTQFTIVSDSPDTNDTFDTWTMGINYTDPDDAPPLELYAQVTGVTVTYLRNFTLVPLENQDFNYTDGRLYEVDVTDLLQGTYTVSINASDGQNVVSTAVVVFVVNPPAHFAFPYQPDFAVANLPQEWTPSDANWQFTRYTDPATVYTHAFWHVADYSILQDQWSAYPTGLDTTLETPLVWVGNVTDPTLKVGLRLSINLGDVFRIRLNANKTGWTTIATYATATVRDWFQFEYALDDYKNNYLEFRFVFTSDDTADLVNNRGVAISGFRIESDTNAATPHLNAPSFTPAAGTRFQVYQFRVAYFDADNNAPRSMKVRVEGTDYDLQNLRGDWDFNAGTGVLYGTDLVLQEAGFNEIQFFTSDGTHANQTAEIQGPRVDPVTAVETFPWTANLNDTSLSEFFIWGTPLRNASNSWLTTNTSWNSVVDRITGARYLYCGNVRNNTELANYGTGWDTYLVLPTVYVQSPHESLLMYTHQFYVDTTAGDWGIIELSLDSGETWREIKRYGNTNQTGYYNWEFDYVDLAEYENYNVTLRFRFQSDQFAQAAQQGGLGWRIKNLTVGAFRELVPPQITLNQIQNNITVNGTLLLNFTILDNDAVNPDRLFLFINNDVVDDSISFVNDTYLYQWDTRQYPNGVARVRLVAEDMAGNQGIINLVFRINNPSNEWVSALVTVLVIVGIVAGLVVFFRYGNPILMERIRRSRARDLDALSALVPEEGTRIQKIDHLLEKLTPEVEEELPFVLYCKKCHTWYRNEKFEWVCPKCNTDTLFNAKKCLVCDKWYFLDGPGEYYCTTRGCNRKLIRDPDSFAARLGEFQPLEVPGLAARAQGKAKRAEKTAAKTAPAKGKPEKRERPEPANKIPEKPVKPEKPAKPEPVKKEVPEEEEEEPDVELAPDEEIDTDEEFSIEDALLEVFDARGTIPSKKDVLAAVQEVLPEVARGEIEKVFALFKKQDRVAYSRSAPAGYSLVSEEPDAEIADDEEIDTDEEFSIEDALVKVFRDRGTIRSKKDVLDAVQEVLPDVARGEIEKIFTVMKKQDRVAYSRSTPVGYSLTPK